MDNATPCLSGYKVTVTGLTAFENTVITIESFTGFKSTEEKRNDKDGSVTTRITCGGYSVGTYTMTLIDQKTQLGARVTYDSKMN